MAEGMKNVCRIGRKLVYAGCAIATVFLIVAGVKKYWDERSFLMSLYSNAAEEVVEHCGGYNIEVGAYKKEYVNWQTMEYHDFGLGELRYSKYAVTIPVEYDSKFEHYEQEITIAVYHYTAWNEESVGAIPDPTIEDHIYVEDMFAGLRKLFGE